MTWINLYLIQTYNNNNISKLTYEEYLKKDE